MVGTGLTPSHSFRSPINSLWLSTKSQKTVLLFTVLFSAELLILICLNTTDDVRTANKRRQFVMTSHNVTADPNTFINESSFFLFNS